MENRDPSAGKKKKKVLNYWKPQLPSYNCTEAVSVPRLESKSSKEIPVRKMQEELFVYCILFQTRCGKHLYFPEVP